MPKKPAKKTKDVKPSAKAKELVKPAPKAAKPVASKPAKPAPKPVAKKAEAKKPEVKVEEPRRPGRPRKDGTADYAVQARKMKALLDTLVTAEELTEAQILASMSEFGFELHPRTLAREVERLAIIGFPVVRIHSPDGILYAMPEDDTIGQAIADLEVIRKALKKEGSAQEKPLQAVIKLLKD
ncbi:MAG: hypothetical protein RL318_1876 [Fibrobacterota bacterium]|jgi:hypothetical protein